MHVIVTDTCGIKIVDIVLKNHSMSDYFGGKLTMVKAQYVVITVQVNILYVLVRNGSGFSH